MKQIEIINGSVRGQRGNTARLLRIAEAHVKSQVNVGTLELADYEGSIEALVERIRCADGFIFGSGVYWNAYGAPLQRFIEVMTTCESTDVFLGKPAAALITMDSVGGTDVAARLLGVLNLWGCSVPPLATVVISRVGLLASQVVQDADVWVPEDVAVLARNMCAAVMTQKPNWEAWPVRTTPTLRGPYPTVGQVAADHPPWPEAWWHSA